MKSVFELYPEYSETEKNCGYFYGAYDYQPMLDQFGNILVQVDDDEYQGDSRVLYKSEKGYGWLQFGWGSCSGCDALRACESMAEVQSLMDELYQSIKWFADAKSCLQFFIEHDWEGDYSWNSSEQKEFVAKCKEVLSSL